MKLRNKKTGEITEEVYVIYDGLKIGNDLSERSRLYKSLADLEEDWEDYKPVEPLIRDEKIRKAVRAWAEANEVVKAFVVMTEHMNWVIHGDDADRNRFRIEFFDRVVSENDETKNYTIAELCGEEEE